MAQCQPPNENEEDVFTYLLVDDKEPEEQSLVTIGKDEAWLRSSLAEAGHSSPVFSVLFMR